MNIFIIGGGISGLIAACNLQKKGYKTTIIEKNNYLGGRLNDFYMKDKKIEFKFSNGPSWYWMDDIFQDIWKELNIPKHQLYKLIKLENQFKLFLNNNEILIPNNFNKILKIFHSIDNNSPQYLQNFVNENQEKYNLSKNIFMRFLNLNIFEYFNLGILKLIFKFGIFDSYNSYFKKIFKNDILVKILEWPSYFIGNNPKTINSIFNILTYSYLKDGTYIPENGMYSIINMLEKHYINLGGRIILNEEIVNLEINKDKIDFIISKKNNILTKYKTDFIICSGDYYNFEKILPKNLQTYSDKYWDKLKLCPSCLIFHLGLKIKLNNLDFHNLFFDLDDNDLNLYLNNFDISQKVPFYLNITSKYLNTFNNNNNETLFILIPVNNNNYKKNEIDICFNNILQRIQIKTNINLQENIILKYTFYNKDYRIYNSFKNNAYGISCENLQFGFIRPSIKSLNVSNLFYCGQNTNPGPGLPPSSLSGLIVSNYLDYTIKNKENIFIKFWNYLNHYLIIIISHFIIYLS